MPAANGGLHPHGGRPAKRVVSNHMAEAACALLPGIRPRSIHLPILARPIGISQIPPKDLARWIARQRLQKVDPIKFLMALRVRL